MVNIIIIPKAIPAFSSINQKQENTFTQILCIAGKLLTLLISLPEAIHPIPGIMFIVTRMAT